MLHPFGRVALVAIASASLLAAHASAQESAAPPAPAAVTLLETPNGADGIPFAYPDGAQALVTAVEVSWPVGSRTGWHRHDVPLFNYLLEGELTVTYEDGAVRTLRTGEAVIEAVGVAHFGANNGDAPARLLSVVLGAEGVPYTVQLPEP
jgi:quercetin dioxygenase-like cupin family protein